LGGERFKEQIEALAKRRAVSKGVGRPKKDNNRDPFIIFTLAIPDKVGYLMASPGFLDGRQ